MVQNDNPASHDWADGWIDATLPLMTGMTTWPGDPQLRTERVVSMAEGAACNVTRLDMCVHTGTHMDAPLHFVAEGDAMERAPLTVLMGRARVIDIEDAQAVTDKELMDKDLQPGERVILKTRTPLPAPDAAFDEDFVYVSHEAACLLADRRVALVGINSPSVGGFRADMVETHLALLGAGIWVVENLDLTQVEAGEYDLICLPLKIVGADGAPARVLLRKR